MRIKIHLRGSGTLPYDYHYWLGSAMYRYKEIANRELSAMLHYSREIKLFTFSEIIVPRRRATREGIRILDDYAYLIYTSPYRDYVEALVTGLLENPELRIGDLRFEISQVEVLPEPQVDWSRVHFKTLSPISEYTSSDGHKKDIPLFPTQKEWYINIERNVKKSYETFYGEEPEGSLRIEALRFKPKRYYLKGKNGGNPIQAVHGHFVFHGDPRLVKMAYEAGVGEHGAFGFGCLGIVKEKN